ncbi:hypothetical protein [Anabaena sp. PCC 7108]|uniref:hypothetical protein n=1 Tax=Anabaena sp. PCC 7108 TaxID=163908 RepID=UPI000349F63B|nr:hypothetical protein [Anabaena sp. PCC 7108]
MKNFPLVNLPFRKFNVGDRVQSLIKDTNSDYLLEGTIFGYQYQHQLWSDLLNSGNDLFLDGTGWIYAVLITYEEPDDETVQNYPLLTHFHEKELELIQGLGHTELLLDKTEIRTLFGCFPVITEALLHSSVFLVGKSEDSEILIDCGNNENIAKQLWEKQSTIKNILRAINLSTKVNLKLDGQIQAFLNTSLDLSSISPLKIPVIMPENLEIIKRAQKHQSLLQAISASSVAVTLHGSNETNGFIYLDLCVDIPERLNKPREELIGYPSSIVDPQISEPRIHHIKRALAHGQCETYSYTYEDHKNDCLWKFNVSVTPVFGTEEVITIVQDAEAWQKGFWLNKLNRKIR